MGICPSSYATRRGVHRVAGPTKARLHANPAALFSPSVYAIRPYAATQKQQLSANTCQINYSSWPNRHRQDPRSRSTARAAARRHAGAKTICRPGIGAPGRASAAALGILRPTRSPPCSR